jgi:hypothetical protein
MTDKQFVKNYVPFRELKREGFFQKICNAGNVGADCIYIDRIVFDSFSKSYLVD